MPFPGRKKDIFSPSINLVFPHSCRDGREEAGADAGHGGDLPDQPDHQQRPLSHVRFPGAHRCIYRPDVL